MSFGGMLFVLIVAAVLGLLMVVLYLLTLQNTLKEVSPENKLIPDNYVWLMLIPLFNILFAFYFYPVFCDSIKNEFEARKLSIKGDYGKSLGLVMPTLGLVALIPSIPLLIPLLIALVNLVVFIIFWIKIHIYKTKLINTSKSINLIGEEID